MTFVTKEIVSCSYNFAPIIDPQLCSSECNTIELHKDDVEHINYNQPRGEGDQHYCEVLYGDGRVERIFNLNKVTWKNKK